MKSNIPTQSVIPPVNIHSDSMGTSPPLPPRKPLRRPDPPTSCSPGGTKAKSKDLSPKQSSSPPRKNPYPLVCLPGKSPPHVEGHHCDNGSEVSNRKEGACTKTATTIVEVQKESHQQSSPKNQPTPVFLRSFSAPMGKPFSPATPSAEKTPSNIPPTLSRLQTKKISVYVNTSTSGGGFCFVGHKTSTPPKVISPNTFDSVQSPFEFRPPPPLASKPPRPLPKKVVRQQEVLETAKKELSSSNFYHGNISHEEAADRLKNSVPGTGLIRDSASNVGGYTFSFKQGLEHGGVINSIRITFLEHRGKFQLDKCWHSDRAKLPEFDSVVELVEFYVKSREGFNCLRDADTGRLYSLHIQKTLPESGSPSSLKHMARLAVNNAVGAWVKRQTTPISVEEVYVTQKVPMVFNYRNKNCNSLDLLQERREIPVKINEYLQQYPYTV